MARQETCKLALMSLLCMLWGFRKAEPEGVRPAALAEGMRTFEFASDELRAAGEYTATAEWEEGRPALARALAKRDASLRSPAMTFQARAPPFPLQTASLCDSGLGGCFQARAVPRRLQCEAARLYFASGAR